MKTKFLIGMVTCFLISGTVQAQELRSFAFHNQSGDEVSFQKMSDQLADYDVVLFGEFHNNSMVHWLQLKLTQQLFQRKDSTLMLGAEMLERHQQEGLNHYLSGKWNAQQMQDSLNLWQNFKTDYLPLVKFAKEQNLVFLATNVPRPYAAMVARKSLDTLDSFPEEDRAMFAELPVKVDMETPGYREMLKMMEGHHGKMKMDPQQMVQAQALKDATMAETILKNRKSGGLFLHFNGNFHSKKHGGIYWYLKKNRPDLKVAVISVFESDTLKLNLPKNKTYTEFNLVIPHDMHKSY